MTTQTKQLNGTFDVHGKKVLLSYNVKEGSENHGKCMLLGFDRFGKRYMGEATVTPSGELKNIKFIKD